MSKNPLEKILLVASNPIILDIIGRQALSPLGFGVKIIGETRNIIQQVIDYDPALVITEMNLSGLSGMDLLVGLTSQGISVPLIVVAEKGQELAVLQALRLGASDYLLWPAKEAEIITTVERVIGHVREFLTSEKLDLRLKITNQKLQQRVKELTTLFSVGKAALSIHDEQTLFDKMVQGMAEATQADYGWLMIRDDVTNQFTLRGRGNLPKEWVEKAGQPLDDGISSLAIHSKETQTLNADQLEQMKAAWLGKSVVAVPIKIQDEVTGVLVMVRKDAAPFDSDLQVLLEVVADYAASSISNIREVRALQETLTNLRMEEAGQKEKIQGYQETMAQELEAIARPMEQVLSGETGPLNDEQEQALYNIKVNLDRLVKLAGKETGPEIGENPEGK